MGLRHIFNQTSPNFAPIVALSIIFLSQKPVVDVFLLINTMPRTSERKQRIAESATSLNRMRKHYVLLLATKASQQMLNNFFNVYSIQCINHSKLVKNRYLKPRNKNRIYKGPSVFIRHLKGKVGRKYYFNDKEFLRTCRMGRDAFKQLSD